MSPQMVLYAFAELDAPEEFGIGTTVREHAIFFGVTLNQVRVIAEFVRVLD